MKWLRRTCGAMGLGVCLLLAVSGCPGPDDDSPSEDADDSPVARAGPNQQVCPGARVTLDGSGSSGANGAPLTFRWSFTARPPGSTATLSDPTSKAPSFPADVVGVYALSLSVNNGRVDSAPDTVTVTASTTVGGLTIVLLAPPDAACQGLRVFFQWRIENQCEGVVYCSDILTDKGVNPFDGHFEDIFHAGHATALEVSLGASTYDPAHFGWGVRVTACDDQDASCPCQGRSFESRIRDLKTNSRAPNCP